MMSEGNSLISVKNDAKRVNLTVEDYNKNKDKVNRALAIGKEDVMNYKEFSKKIIIFAIFILWTIEYGNYIGKESIKMRYEFISRKAWVLEREISNIIVNVKITLRFYNYYSDGQHFEKSIFLNLLKIAILG